MKEKRSKEETKWKFGTKNRFTIRFFKKSVKWEVKPRQRTQSISLVFFNPNACSGEFLRSKQRANRKKIQKKKTKIPSFFLFAFSFTEFRLFCRERLPMDYTVGRCASHGWQWMHRISREISLFFGRIVIWMNCSKVFRVRSGMQTNKDPNRTRIEIPLISFELNQNKRRIVEFG